jgi:hypothetical protein
MKSVAVLGLGVIALTTGAFITASEAAGHGTIGSLAKGSYFEAAVYGAVDAQPSGGVSVGVVGDEAAGMAAFTITLGATDSAGAILFTSLDGAMPAPGRYLIDDPMVPGGEGFRASYVGGSPERPTGDFWGRSGILEITSVSPGHVSGHFSFTGVGFTTADPSNEQAEVQVNGAFVSRRAEGR